MDSSKNNRPVPTGWDKHTGVAAAAMSTYSAIDMMLMTALTPILKNLVYSWAGPVICVTSADFMLKAFGL